jgi:hypothetical protein
VSLSVVFRFRTIPGILGIALVLAALLVLPGCWVSSINPLYEEGSSLNPDHHFPAVDLQIFGGDPSRVANMKGFVKSYFNQQRDVGHSQKIMYYFAQKDLPVLTTLALEFAVFNRWFASIPGPTICNRAFAHYGTSFGRVDMNLIYINEPFKFGNSGSLKNDAAPRQGESSSRATAEDRRTLVSSVEGLRLLRPLRKFTCSDESDHLILQSASTEASASFGEPMKQFVKASIRAHRPGQDSSNGKVACLQFPTSV